MEDFMHACANAAFMAQQLADIFGVFNPWPQAPSRKPQPTQVLAPVYLRMSVWVCVLARAWAW
eukprot:651914-Alexandrium_andersonii.AAC.1